MATTEKVIWDYLYGKLGNAYGVAGLMGNLAKESGLASNNLQNSGNKKLGLTDVEYTAQVDAGTYTNFVRDGYGYGLTQWTYWSRKQNLLNYANSKGVSIGDQTMQLEFLFKELSEGYKSVLNALKAATSVLEASNAVLFGFEKPADQSASVQAQRAACGQGYYDKYAASSLPYTVKITISNLNIRTGAGVNYAKTGKYTGKGVFTVVEEAQGAIDSKGTIGTWGKLKSGAGWICLSVSGVTKQ